MKPQFRWAVQKDEAFLWKVLAISAHSSEAEARTDPVISRYLLGWKKQTDIGLIALDNSAQAVGAAWVRCFGPAISPFHYLPEAPYQLIIGVCTPGQGIGSLLLTHLIKEIDAQGSIVLSLNVRANSRAVALYLRAGFRVVDEITNRVGTTSLIMVRDR